jgi:hypothetical protein
MATEVYVGTINGGNTVIVVDGATNAATFVVNRSTTYDDKKIYDLRFASKQQIHQIDVTKAVPLEETSMDFLKALTNHVIGPIREILKSFIPEKA